jgi:hypothetical protein
MRVNVAMRFVLLFALLAALSGCASPIQPSGSPILYCSIVFTPGNPGPNPHQDVGTDHICTPGDLARDAYMVSTVPGWYCLNGGNSPRLDGAPHQSPWVLASGESDGLCYVWQMEQYFGHWPTASLSHTR